jgi:DNA-binding beta-propeller fold protein YncE
MTTTKNLFRLPHFVLGISACVLALATTSHAAPLTAGDAIELTGAKGGCDFIRIDTAANRLLLGHTGNKSFDVFDIASKKLLKVVATSTAQDAVADVKRGKYYVSGNDPARMVIVDSTTLEITGDVPTAADTDLIGFNPATGLVYECNDTAGEVWVIDPAAKKIVSTIKVDGGGMEDLALDAEGKHLYQAAKKNSTIAVIDPAKNTVTETWALAPNTGPHGIAIVPDSDGLLVACAGKLVLLNRTNGKIITTAPIASRVDEMAYDPALHLAYCSSRTGKISVVAVAADKLTALEDVASQPGAGNIAVDPKTHTVWIAFSKGKDGPAFVQPFTPAK